MKKDTVEAPFPPFRGDARRAGGCQIYFLEQPRRGKTREALITPHKRSAVWGLTQETVPDCGDSDNGKAQRSVGLTLKTASDRGDNDNE